MPFADVSPQLPRVLDASRPPEVLVTAEYDDGCEVMMRGLVRVPETKIERVLARQERHDVGPRHVRAEIGDKVTQVVFFLRPHCTVGNHDPHVLASQRTNGVVGVDPRVDALRRLQLGARRAEFDCDDRRLRCAKESKEGCQSSNTDRPVRPYFFGFSL